MNDTKLVEAIKEAGGNIAPGALAYAPPPQLLMLAQSLLDGIKAGHVTSMGCVIVGPRGDIRWPGFGMQTAEILIGAELMRDDMKAAMRGGQSKIVRAG